MFVWSDLTRELIIDLLYSKKHFLVKKMSVQKFHKKLSYQIKKIAKVRVNKFLDKKVERHVVCVGGSYCSDLDQDNKTAITIDCYYNSKYKLIYVCEINYYQLCVTIADVLMHEIIHMRQHRKRDFASIKEFASSARSQERRMTQNYLGHKDEVEAYSFNIACELQDKFNENDAKIKMFLDGNLRIKTNKMLCYQQYIKAFNRNWNHPVMVSLKKQIEKNLNKAKIGKPFKNNYWLYY